MGNKPAGTTCRCEDNAELVAALDRQCNDACTSNSTTVSQLQLLINQLEQANNALEREDANCTTHRRLRERLCNAAYYYFRLFELDVAELRVRQQQEAGITQGEITQGEKTPRKEKEEGEREDSRSTPF